MDTPPEKIVCIGCKTPIRFDASLLNRKAKHKKCNTSFTVHLNDTHREDLKPVLGDLLKKGLNVEACIEGCCAVCGVAFIPDYSPSWGDYVDLMCRTSPNTREGVQGGCPKCKGKYLVARVVERGFAEIFKDHCDRLTPSKDDLKNGVLDVETNQMRKPYGMDLAGSHENLWQRVGKHLDPTGTLSLMGFDVFYLPNGDSYKVRWCPCLRHAEKKNGSVSQFEITDIVKSSDGLFWYGTD